MKAQSLYVIYSVCISLFFYERFKENKLIFVSPQVVCAYTEKIQLIKILF